MITIILIITILLVYIIFRNLNLGYSIKEINYSHSITGSRTINIGIPKLSFMKKNNDYSYSYKNLRNSTVLEKEIKDYLKTLNYSTCNDTIYYYNKEDNFSIIEYSAKNNFIYSTISYAIVDNDYCYTQKLNEYSKKLGGLKNIHSLNESISQSDNNWKSKVVIMFIDGGDNPDGSYEFKASLTIYKLIKITEKEYQKIMLEESSGDYEIKDDKLYYYRKEITNKEPNLKIPEVSIFEIKDTQLYLTDNYLSNHQKEDIILR